jgi:hypothetical protein
MNIADLEATRLAFVKRWSELHPTTTSPAKNEIAKSVLSRRKSKGAATNKVTAINAIEPKITGQGHREQITLPVGRRTKVYLAGKVKANDWRNSFTEWLGISSPSTWRQTVSRPMFNDASDDVELVGPFPIACDHRCFHGRNSHGCGRNTKIGCGDHSPVTDHEIFEKCRGGIQSCDLFFVWADIDFGSAHGTMFEIGLAHALGKQIVIVCHPDLDTTDFWFVFQKANCLLSNRNPKEAFAALFKSAAYK